MTTTREQEPKPKPSYSPYYCALYPAIAEIARKHGYACSIHGSMQRDFDLVCIPWIKEPTCDSTLIIEEILSEFAFKQIGESELKPHGRLAYTLASYGECFVDISFMPTRCGL